MTMLSKIEGIGPVLTEKFREAGVRSVEQLLQTGGSRRGRADLAARAGLSEDRLLRLVNCADLMRIRGVGGEYAELLEAAGVDTVPELGQRNPASLTQKMAAVNAEKKLVRAVPTEPRVRSWIAQAKALPRAVRH